MFDLSLMRMLAIVAEESSLARAGERLGLTQQAVSARLKRLEAMSGRVLVHRHGDGNRLTGDGQTMLAYATRAIALNDEIRRHFAGHPLKGRLRIGVVEGFTLNGLTTILGALGEGQPGVQIHAMTGRTARLEAMLDAGHLDIVLGLQRAGETHGERLLTDRLRWVGDFTRFRDPKVTIPLATFPQPSVARGMLAETLAAAGRPHVIVFESESRSSLRAAVLSGMAVSAFCLEIDPVLSAGILGVETMPRLGDIELFMRERLRGDELTRVMTDFLRASYPRMHALFPPAPVETAR